MNKKGFMMAEVVVVSVIVLVSISAFFTGYNSLISLYNERLNYYDPTTLYMLANYRDTEYENLSSCVNDGVALLKESSTETVYCTSGDHLAYLEQKSINKTFKNYISYLASSLDYTGENSYKYVLVMERCESAAANCKYAYLDVLTKDK